MTITALPEAPSRSDDSDTFVAKADATMAALPILVTELNELIALGISSLNYNGTSTTSVAIGTGSKSFTMEAGKLLQVGQFVIVASTSNPANYMFGQVTSYNSTTGALVVDVSSVGGSGTIASWTISLNPAGTYVPLTTANVWAAIQTMRANGTPLVVDSLDSAVSKIALQAASVTKGYIGTGATGAALLDSAGATRIAATTAGASVTGTFDVDGTATLGDATTDSHVINGTSVQTASGAAVTGQTISMTHASFTGTGLIVKATRAGTSAYFLISAGSNAGADAEFYVNGVGSVASDGGTAMTTPADYADAMEWADGNTKHEDRVGFSVVLVGDKVRKATSKDDPEDIIGIVSADPSVIGGSGITRWVGKYATDEFGRVIIEDYEVVNDDGETVIQQRRKLAANFNPEAPYTPRLERAEWDPIGLCGRVRLRKGCPTNPRWRKMRDVSATVEEWLVR